MPYSFDDIDVIDLERALDEGRITPFVDNKSYKISLKSVDDDVLNNIRGSLVTPLPNDRPVSRTESVMLFKNILNGNEQVTVDFVSSDLNDFIGNFAMDDLSSRPGSRAPFLKTPPLHHHNSLRLNNDRYSDLHKSSPPTNDDRSNQGYVRDYKRHLAKEEYPLHIHGYTPSTGFTRRRSSPSLIDTTTLDKNKMQLLSTAERLYRSEELKRISQRNIKHELSFDKAKKRHSLNMGLYHQISDENTKDPRRWSSSYIPDHNEPVYPNNNDPLYLQQQQRVLGRNNGISQRRQSELGYSNYRPSKNNGPIIPVAEPHQPPQKPRLQPQRGVGGKPLLNNHVEATTHRNRAYSVPTTEPIDHTYKRDRRFSNNNTVPKEKPVSFIPQPRRRSSKLYESDINSSLGGETHEKISPRLYPLPTRSQKQEQERRQLLAQKRHSYIEQTIPRDEVFRPLPPKDPSRRQRVLSEGTRTKKVSMERKSTVVEDAKNVLEMVRQRRQNTMSKR